MCTMTIPARVCRQKPVKIIRDKALEGLPDFIRKKCSTHESAKAYFASVGLRRSGNGSLTVVPM